MQVLGNEILFRILRNTSQQPFEGIDDWGLALPLLGVCSQWRQALAPAVYSYAYVIATHTRKNDLNVLITEMDRLEELEANELGIIRIPDAEQPQHVQLTTNLDLLQSSPVTYSIHTVHLLLYDIKSRFFNILNVVNLLKTYSLPWHSVTALNLETHSMYPVYYGSGPNTMLIEKHKYITSQLASVLPNITALRFLGLGTNRVISNLCASLVSIYSPQLHYLHSGRQLMSNTHNIYLQTPTFLHLQLDIARTYQLYKVFAGSLLYLKLNILAEDMPWHQFCNYADQPELIYFASLHTLHVNYNGQSKKQTELGTYQFCFPRLQNLHITGCTNNYELLANSVFPAHLNHVSIDGDITAAHYLATSGIKQANHLSVSVNNTDAIDSSVMLPIINKLFGLNGMAVTGSFHAQGSFIAHANLHQADWSRVHTLSICMPPQLSTLVKQICLMTSLQSLKLNCTGEFTVDLPVSNPCLITTTIRNVDITCPQSSSSIEKALDVLLYMAQISPHIRRITSPDIPQVLLKEIIEENEQQYPHLQNCYG